MTCSSYANGSPNAEKSRRRFDFGEKMLRLGMTSKFDDSILFRWRQPLDFFDNFERGHARRLLASASTSCRFERRSAWFHQAKSNPEAA